MRLSVFLFSCFLVLLGQAQTTFPENGAPYYADRLYIIKGATVHVDPETTLDKADVWIKEGRFQQVTQGKTLPIQAVIVEAKGRHVYPSFIELYSSYGLPEKKSGERRQGPQYKRTEKGAMGWNEAIHPERDALIEIRHDEKTAKSFRAAGFGSVLSHRQDGIMRGTAVLTSFADAPLNETVRKDRAALFMSFDKGSSKQDYPSSKMGSIALIRQTLYDAKWYASGGSDEEYNLSLDRLNVLMDLPQFFVTKEKNDIMRADRIAKEFGMEFHYIGSGNEYERAQEVASVQSAVVLPLDYPEGYDLSDPFAARHVQLQELRHWEQAPANAAYLEAMSVPVSFTTHGVKKKEFLPAIRKAIEHGLSPKKAMEGLTRRPAELLGVWQDMGSVTAGKWADFFIASDDIFQSGSRILEHWVQGIPHEVEGLDRTELNGVYDLKVGVTRYSLTVVSEDEAYILSDQTTDSTKVKVTLKEDDRQVNLHFNWPDEGLYRLHGKMNTRLSIWDGRAVDPEGRTVPWSAIWKRKAEKKDRKKKEPKAKVSVLHYPNNAYGWTERLLPENLVIRNATVWTNGPEGIMEDTDVVIRDGRIAAVGHNLALADVFPKERSRPDFQTIEAYGKHVTCGIIDEHSHIAITGGVNEGTQASSAEVSIADVIHPEDLDIFHQLSGGVTVTQLLHGSANPIGGQSALIKMRWGLGAEDLKIQGARPFIKFALGENVKQSNWGNRYRTRFPQTRMGVEQIYYDYFIRAKEYRSEWDLGQQSRTRGRRAAQTSQKQPRKDLELEVLAQILFDERSITCHSYVQSEVNMLMHVGDSLGFKVNTFTHILEGYKVADKMAEHGAGGSTFSDWWAYKYEVREATPYNAALLHDMGVTVAINSDDAEMGRRLNQEAAKALKYGGMSQEDAWKTVTLNPAKLLHLDDRMGSLEVGKDADVVIWSDNPLSIYAKAEKTWVDGVRFFDRSRLKEMQTANSKERAALSEKMMSESNGGGAPPSAKMKKHYHCDDMEP